MAKSIAYSANLPHISAQEAVTAFEIGCLSRQASLLGRIEVLNGRAKFGIFGDGKEVAQLALAHFFKEGDWRSGYYRDQTLMMALKLLTVKEFFAQLYADADPKREPHSQGRQMNCHFSSPLMDDNGDWLMQTKRYNSSADISPTGGQMPRLLGLAYASKLYRNSSALNTWDKANLFSLKGNEIAFGTIGNASTSEGLFFESINAAGVLQVPFLVSVWDDDYGISVPNKFQTTKSSIFSALKGFEKDDDSNGFMLFQVKGHDYEKLLETYFKATKICREKHIPCLIHVVEMTQPQGHSTSGSQERYKSKERLVYEEQIDCLKRMKAWIAEKGLCSTKELTEIEEECSQKVKNYQQEAFSEFQKPLIKMKEELLKILGDFKIDEVVKSALNLKNNKNSLRKDIASTAYSCLLATRELPKTARDPLLAFYERQMQDSKELYSSHLYSQMKPAAEVLGIACVYSELSEKVDGRQIIQRYFAKKMQSDPRIFIIGEDVGQLGGVNLEFEGLLQEFGESRISDTGIREATILGQGIGAALRGLRPIADIQYLDYLLFCLQGMSDDLATLHYRSAGRQSAPLIVRTKGHRLEGIWHTGSPMQLLLGALRGVCICVPRNCTQAAGMYETLLQGNDPGLVIEVLNGYRIKETCPDNLGEYRVALGECEILREGKDITIVTYGANVRIALKAAERLKELQIESEVIDIQTLIPFDRKNTIYGSICKTNAVIFFDEDFKGGASAYMMQKVLEEQGAFAYLDCTPRTLSAKDHRSAYGSDGDYFSKPTEEDLISLVYATQRERDPQRFPDIVPIVLDD